MKITDRLLFLKYALPCASTLVKRGVVSQEYIDSLVLMVSEGRVPDEEAEKMFKVANAMCGSIAGRMGKESIDSDVIREYFLMEHSEVVDDRFELMRDFDPVDCKTYAGTVIEVGNRFATIETALGRKRYRTTFAKGIKKNDKVAVHFDFVIEKIDDATAKRMDGIRVAYEKNKHAKH